MHFHFVHRPGKLTRRRGRYRIQPEVMRLEERAMLSLTIQINYEFDTNDFFNTQAKKDAMQTVANQVAATINDHLAAIVPSGTNIWTAAFVDPSSGADREVNNLVVPADTLLVYVGGQALPFGVGAEAGPGTSAPYSTVPVTPGEDPAYEAWSATVTQRGKSQPPGPTAPALRPGEARSHLARRPSSISARVLRPRPARSVSTLCSTSPRLPGTSWDMCWESG